MRGKKLGKTLDGACISFFVSFLLHFSFFLTDSSFCFDNYISLCVALQVLRYFDYVFTGVFTFEMLIKVTKYHSVRVCVWVHERL